MAGTRDGQRGELRVPSTRQAAIAELSRIRKRKPLEIAALERCWQQLDALWNAYTGLGAKLKARPKTPSGVPLAPMPPGWARHRSRPVPHEVFEKLAADLLGEGVDRATLAFMTSELDDRVIVIFIDRRRNEVIVPHLYTYCRVLLGLRTVSARDHAIAELVHRKRADFPATTDDWLQRLNTWEKRLNAADELNPVFVESSIRKWATRAGLKI